jgi:hypothetical protein
VVESRIVNGGPFSQQQPNEMVQLADGRLVNAGLVADFYRHGYTQAHINELLAGVINGNG